MALGPTEVERQWLARWRVEANGRIRSKQFATKDEAGAEAARREGEGLTKAVVTGPGPRERLAGGGDRG